MKKNVGKLFVVLMLLFQSIPVAECAQAITTESEQPHGQQVAVSSEALKESTTVSDNGNSTTPSQASVLKPSTSSQSSTTVPTAKSSSSSQSLEQTTTSTHEETKQTVPKAPAPTPAITKGINTDIEREETPEILINYEEELLEGFDSAAAYELRFGNKNKISVSNVVSYKITEEMFGKVWKIVRLGNGHTTQESLAQDLTIGWRQQLPESLITVEDETEKDKNDGKLIGVDAKMQYRKQGETDWLQGALNGIVENLDPGAYEVRYAANHGGDKFASLPINKTINPGLEREETPTIRINYEMELLEDFDPEASYELRFDTNNIIFVSNIASYKITENMFSKVWKIVRLGDRQTTQESKAQNLTIKDRQQLPENLIKVEGETEKNKNDGKLIGVGLEMQYRKQGETDWLQGASNDRVENLGPGTYEVRYAANQEGNKFASLPIEKTIKPGLEREEAPAFTIDYENEKFLKLDPAAIYELTEIPVFPLREKLNKPLVITPGQSTYQITEEMLGKKWRIVRKARSAEFMDSQAQDIYLDQRFNISAETFTAIKETRPGAGDGKLKNVFKNTQYREKGSPNWLDGETHGTVEHLPEAVYEIRYKGDTGQRMFASEIIEVDLANGLIQKIKPEIKIDYERELLYDYLLNEQYKTASYVIDHWIYAPQPKNLEVPITEEMFDTWTYINIEEQIGISVASDVQKFVIPKRQTLDGKTISVDHETYGGAKDGRLTGIFTTMEYRRTGSNKWLKGTTDGTIKNLSPGTYEIRQAGSNAEQKFASLPITREIKAGVPKAKTPQLSLNYEGETLDGLDVSATYQLTLDGKEYLVKGIKSYAIPPEMFGKDITIIQVGDGKDSLNSDPQKLMIKARPVIDTKVIQAINVSGQKKQDGQLKGITADMEYRISGTSAWHQGTKEGVISNLSAGTYEIRYSSSNEKQRFASASIEKIIGTRTESVPTGPSEKPSAGKPVPKQPANKTQNTKVQAGQISKAVRVEKPSVKARPKSLLKAGDEPSYNMILVGIGLLAVLILYWKKRYKKS